MQPPPVLIFPDVVADMCHLLRAVPDLAGVNVTANKTTLDGRRPSIFIERAGGQRSRFLDTPFLLIEARAGSDDAAWDITNLARSTIHAATRQMGWVALYEVGGPSWYNDDPESGPFYRWTVAISVRGDTPTSAPLHSASGADRERK